MASGGGGSARSGQRAMRPPATRSPRPHPSAGHPPRPWWPAARRTPRPSAAPPPARPRPRLPFPGRTCRRWAAAGRRSARGPGAARRRSCRRSAPPPPAPGRTRPARAPAQGSGGTRSRRPRGTRHRRERSSRAGLSSASRQPPGGSLRGTPCRWTGVPPRRPAPGIGGPPAAGDSVSGPVLAHDHFPPCWLGQSPRRARLGGACAHSLRGYGRLPAAGSTVGPGGGGHHT